MDIASDLPVPEELGHLGALPEPVIPGKQQLHPRVASVFGILDGAGSPWLLLRGEDDLALPAGDVDILVDKDILPRLDGLMAAAGFCRVLAWGHGSHRFYFCYSAEEGAWIKLDVVSELAFGPYQQWRTSWAARCLRRRIRHGSYWMPDVADQAWLLLLHLFMDKGGIAAARQEPARTAAKVAADGGRIAESVRRRVGAGLATDMLNLVLAGRFEDAPAMAARLRASWSGGAGPMLIEAVNRTLRRSGARFRGHTPLLGVMAPDGAGKTTLLNGLHADVPLPTKYVYMGLWGAGPFDAVLNRIPGGRTAKKVYRLVRGGVVARFYRRLGKVVLMDRVAYDALLAGSGGGPLAWMSNRLALAVIPAPDVLLVLDVPGAVMFERKGEHSPELLETWRNDYLQLAGRLPGSRVVDAAQPVEAVQRVATGIIWDTCTPAAGRATTAGRATHPAPAVGLSSGSDAAPEAGAGEALSLHLWRLLDWRFLLPVLQPRTLGFAGRISPETESALRLLDPQAMRLAEPATEPATRPGGRACDVVLLASPGPGQIESAGLALEPGGWICVEASRSLLQHSGPRTLRGWKRMLERRGYQDVALYWNAPNRERTARLVPVQSGVSIRDTLALRKDVRFGVLKAAAVHVALALRVFDLLVPEGTITGRLPERSPGQ
ncbi:dTMP kinase [Pseudarthrobacter sp. alpha12b]